MKTNLFLAVPHETTLGEYRKGELLATADLEVVPGGTYVISGVRYTLVGRPTFHINKRAYLYQGATTHELKEVDLLVLKG